MADGRWATPFGVWIAQYGVVRLVEELALAGTPVTVQAAYNWLSGRATPRVPLAQRIVSLSAGAVRLEDLVAHRASLGRREAPAARTSLARSAVLRLRGVHETHAVD
jgi:hypothetical protein